MTPAVPPVWRASRTGAAVMAEAKRAMAEIVFMLIIGRWLLILRIDSKVLIEGKQGDTKEIEKS
jgi:hypothetical protein